MSLNEVNVVYVFYAMFENSVYGDIRFILSHDLYDVMQEAMDMHLYVLMRAIIQHLKTAFFGAFCHKPANLTLKP
jgi:hypothetical protein